MAVNVVDSLVRFQESGNGFEEVWAEIGLATPNAGGKRHCRSWMSKLPS
jgi:hypothetical protein